MESLHRDPTFDAVAAMEIREKGCSVCTRSIEYIEDVFRCSVSKKFPACRGKKNGFDLDEG